jgi:T4 beta protein
MTTTQIYVPILKGKEGEFAALEVLTAEVKRHLMPLIEVPKVPYDYANDRPAKSLDDHVAGIAERLRKCFSQAPLYLDLPWFEGEEDLRDGRVAFESVLNDCARLGVQAVPVVSRVNSPKYLAAARRYAATSRRGICVRLLVKDFEEEIDLDAEIDRLLIGLSDTECDLLIDLEDLSPVANREVLVARSIFSMIPTNKNWRRMIMAATSFPEDLSDVDAATTTKLPRREWELWQTLQRRSNKLPRPNLIFGDYAISHPIPTELDPRTMRMSANIRYTTPNDWLVLKGRNVRQYGFDQYFELCKVLVDRAEFSGKQFSWGDNYIAECADGLTGPGNATTWRKVGTNHHLTLVVKEIAKLGRGV